MKRLQTRVDDKIALKFQKAARIKGKSAYSFLREIVTKVAATEPGGWDDHWTKLKALNLKPSRRTLADLRAETKER